MLGADQVKKHFGRHVYKPRGRDRVYMWEVEPRLYWRVKVNGKWTWRKAEVSYHLDEKHDFVAYLVQRLEYPSTKPEVE